MVLKRQNLPSTVAPKPKVPVWKDLAISGTSVATATVFTNPIDVLKTRLQLQPHSAHAARLGILGMSGHVLQTEGVASLAKGMGPSLARGMLYGGLRLGLYAPTKRSLTALPAPVAALKGRPAQPPAAKEGLVLKVAAGTLSGGLAAALTNPMELLKTRLQAPNLVPGQRSTLGVIKSVMAMDGSRAAALTASQCATYDEAKHFIVRQTGWGDRSLSTQLAASLATGLVTTTAANPMDVVKTRMYTSTKKGPQAAQAPPQGAPVAVAAAAAGGVATPSAAVGAAGQVGSSAGSSAGGSGWSGGSGGGSSGSGSGGGAAAPVAPRTGPIAVAGDLIRREGLRGMLRGWSANYARLGPQTLITFIVSEKLRELAGLPSL